MGHAQDVGPAQFTMPAAPEISEADPATQAAAVLLLRQAADAFRSAPAVIAKTTVVNTTAQSRKEVVVESMFGPDGFVRIESPDSIVDVRNGVMRLVFHQIYDRYIEVPIGNSMVDGVEAVIGDPAMAGFEAMLREGLDPGKWLEVVMMRSLGKPVISGLEMLQTQEGQPINRILVAGGYGTGWIDYRPDLKQIVGSHAEMSVVVNEDLEPFELVMNMTTEIQFVDALPSEIVFDPGIRTPVATRRDLDPVTRNRRSIGDQAPLAKLYDTDGKVFDLSTTRGRHVLLGFWTSSAPVSRKGIDQLESIYRQSLDPANDISVDCYAVNIMERIPDDEPRRLQAKKFWEQAGLTVPSLVESGQDVLTAWGITTVPYLVLIGPDGVIIDQQIGVDEGWPKRVLRALHRAEPDKPAE